MRIKVPDWIRSRIMIAPITNTSPLTIGWRRALPQYSSAIVDERDFMLRIGSVDSLCSVKAETQFPLAVGLPMTYIGAAGAAPFQHLDVTFVYSRTKMFFFAHISFRIFGHTVTLTSPKCALRNKSIKVRDWPIPPPMESGRTLLTIPW